MRRFLSRFSLIALALVLAACQVVVDPGEPAVTEVTVTPSQVSRAVGETVRFSADVEGVGNFPRTVTWSSNNRSVAAVNDAGLVTAVAPGNAVITAISTFDPTKSGTATITVRPGAGTDPWANAPQVTAVSEPNVPVLANENVTSGSPRYYRVTLPANLSQPLVYVELVNASAGATVEIFSAATPRQSVYASRTPEWFGETAEVLALSDDDAALLGGLETQQLVQVACRGPCIIFPRELQGQAVTIYVRVSTTGPGTVGYDFHVYDDNYNDPGEPQVSQCQGFPNVGPAAMGGIALESPVSGAFAAVEPLSIIVDPVDPVPLQGALETVRDRDCYETSVNVNRIELTASPQNTGIFMRAEIFDAATNVLLDTLGVTPQSRVSTSGPLGNVPVRIVVYAANGRAGPSANSFYDLGFLD